MAKKSTSTFAAGTRIKVKPGVCAPESAETSIAGWTGTIFEVNGKKTTVQYIVEWDEPTVQNMPPAYLAKCEAAGLYHKMACLSPQDIEAE